MIPATSAQGSAVFRVEWGTFSWMDCVENASTDFTKTSWDRQGVNSVPPGTTTPGRASRGAESCSVKMILEEDNSELYTGIGTSIATLVVVVAIMTAVIFKVRKLELKLGEGAVKLQKKDCQPDAFNFQEEDANVVSLCTIRRLDDNGVPLT